MPDPRGDQTSVLTEAASTEVERFLRRRARGRRVLVVVLTLLLSSVVVGNVWRQYRGGDDWARFDRRFFVVQAVMAGDRLAVESADGSVAEMVQLLGVDAPDRAGPPGDGGDRPAGRRADEHGAADAYRALRDLAQNRRVMLALPPLAPRSADGRLLAYVYLDGRSDADGDAARDDAAGTGPTLNEQLVADGRGYADRRSTHPMHKAFEQAEADARKKGRGLWADVRDDQQPAWRRAWLAGMKRGGTEGGQPASVSGR